MMPYVFKVPGINWLVPGYGVCLMVGFLLATAWAVRRAVRSGGSPDVVLNCAFIALLGGVVGCRAMYVIHYWERDFASRGGIFDVLFAIIDVSRGGMEFYGGFILATVGVLVWLALVEKVSIRWYLDILAPSAALGLAIGRIGCFMNGCCYGSTCELPWAVKFPYGSTASYEQWQGRLPGAGLPKELMYTFSTGTAVPLSRESLMASDADIESVVREEQAARKAYDAARKALADAPAADKASRQRAVDRAKLQVQAADSRYKDLRSNMEKYALSAAQIRAVAASTPSLPVHPTQWYSTITAGLLALLLNALYWRRTRDGVVIASLLFIEPITRWMLEVIRADNPVDTLGAFTISQALALGMSLIGAVWLATLRFLPPRAARAAIFIEPPPPPKKPKRAT